MRLIAASYLLLVGCTANRPTPECCAVQQSAPKRTSGARATSAPAEIEQKHRGQSGTVVAKIFISPAGRVERVTIISNPFSQGIADAVTELCKTWAFEPTGATGVVYEQEFEVEL